MNENSTLYLMMLCQLGQLSQWPVFNRPTVETHIEADGKGMNFPQ